MYDTEWVYLHNNDWEICKCKNKCKKLCKHRNICKLYVMRMEEGIVNVQRACKNVKLPVRGTEEVAGCGLAAAEASVSQAQGKVLVETGLEIALPPSC